MTCGVCGLSAKCSWHAWMVAQFDPCLSCLRCMEHMVKFGYTH